MANKIYNLVTVSQVEKSGDLKPKFDFPVTVVVEYDPQGLSLKLKRERNGGRMEDVYEIPVSRTTECARIGPISYLFNLDSESLCLKFPEESAFKRFHSHISEAKIGKGNSVFCDRTEDASAVQYFQFYGYLSQQQNMLQDYVRTSTYQKAILANSDDFRDKVVLDVGAGSGILSFFAVQAGAKRVYAVEASAMAQHAETLVRANNMSGKVLVIAGKIEEVELPEKVDIIISEPMGYMLYNERMLETFLHAKKWLKPGGIMFPTRGDLHIAPFTDESLFQEQINKANFWVQSNFHGVNLSCLRETATKEYFQQPIVDVFDIRICMARSQKHTVDFRLAQESELHRIEIPVDFEMLDSGTVHGLAFWFDVAFVGRSQTVWLSTAPTEPLTHWYQVRCLLQQPVFIRAGERLIGKVTLQANQRQSYDVTIELSAQGKEHTRCVNTLDLKNPYFRYSGQPVPAPPGTSTTSPSEEYWRYLDSQQDENLTNGVTSVNGVSLAEDEMDISQTHVNGIVPLPRTGRRSNNAAQFVCANLSPSQFNPSAQQMVIGNTPHSLLFGDYASPNNGMLS